MKTSNLTLMALLALGLGALTPLTQAQQARTNRPAAGQRLAAAGVTNRLETIAKELKLTPEQKEKLAPILKEEGEKTRALRTDQALSQADRRTKMLAIREATTKQLAGILTPEQLTQYKELSSQRGQRGQGGTAGAPGGQGGQSQRRQARPAGGGNN